MDVSIITAVATSEIQRENAHGNLNVFFHYNFLTFMGTSNLQVSRALVRHNTYGGSNGDVSIANVNIFRRPVYE